MTSYSISLFLHEETSFLYPPKRETHCLESVAELGLDAKCPNPKSKAFLYCATLVSSPIPCPSEAEGNRPGREGTQSQESWSLDMSKHCRTNQQA